jgi:predicted thioredoxin/glutaredoxin
VALELLRNRQARYGYRLVIIDVDSDPELVAKFDACVPVVAIDGKVRFRGRVEPALLDRQLRGDTANLD